ncbi:hypothetical protein BDB00DRAFT_759900, partial [Zychaea mexicana]|uniref:uncharacterized protein n=1 Tax=Zychaea mexicana TaxID=64656 RepID=UPI0022FF43C8
VWRGVATRFLDDPSALTFEHVSSVRPPTPLKTKHLGHISGRLLIACTFLAIWRAHWLFVFQQQRFWPNGVVASSILLLRKINAEHQTAV